MSSYPVIIEETLDQINFLWA